MINNIDIYKIVPPLDWFNQVRALVPDALSPDEAEIPGRLNGAWFYVSFVMYDFKGVLHLMKFYTRDANAWENAEVTALFPNCITVYCSDLIDGHMNATKKLDLNHDRPKQ